MIQLLSVLQLTKVRGVGRRNVDYDVTGIAIGLVQANQVVVNGVFYGRIKIFSDVDTEYPAVIRFALRWPPVCRYHGY